jgi:uncharacterized metal-binding protein YceD (DUF177 family)
VTDPTPSASQLPSVGSPNALDPAWVVEVRSIGESGQNSRFQASAEQCASLARDLDLISCNSLTVTYKLRSQHRGRYRLTGKILADVVQRCVVTLEPVPALLDEDIDLEFWPTEQLAATPTPGVTQEGSDEHSDTADFDALGDEPAEPIDNGRIGLGRVVYELVSAGLNPYPRSPGAEFNWAVKDDGADKPFAALAKLKLKPAVPPVDRDGD